jgi:hypothetical protein
MWDISLLEQISMFVYGVGTRITVVHTQNIPLPRKPNHQSAMFVSPSRKPL